MLLCSTAVAACGVSVKVHNDNICAMFEFLKLH